MIRGLENLTQEERLKNLGLLCLEKRSFIGGGVDSNHSLLIPKR